MVQRVSMSFYLVKRTHLSYNIDPDGQLVLEHIVSLIRELLHRGLYSYQKGSAIMRQLI